MKIDAIYKRVCGLDVHKKTIVGTVILEDADGQLQEETRKFGTLPSELEKLAAWIKEHDVELTVMESTGVFWKPVYAALEEYDLKIYVVNARHVKNVPGRKTDVTDSQWLASLARCGLLKNSFVPDKGLRDFRVLTRRRIKVQRMIAQETLRLHKALDAVGFCVSTIVSDVRGVSGRAIINGLVQGETIELILSKLKGAVKKKVGQLKEILTKPLPETERFILDSVVTRFPTKEQGTVFAQQRGRKMSF